MHRTTLPCGLAARQAVQIRCTLRHIPHVAAYRQERLGVRRQEALHGSPTLCLASARPRAVSTIEGLSERCQGLVGSRGQATQSAANALKVPEIKEELHNLGVNVPSGAKKAELVSLLVDAVNDLLHTNNSAAAHPHASDQAPHQAARAVRPSPGSSSAPRERGQSRSRAPATGMDITWLGTSSGSPTLSRNVSGAAIRTSAGSVWLVDCGEGSARQLERTGKVEAARVTRIFITHLHGDHVYGLPNMVAHVDRSRKDTPFEGTPLHVYGPVGTHDFVLASLETSGIVLSAPVLVTEWVLSHEKAHPARPTGVDGMLHRARAAPNMTGPPSPGARQGRGSGGRSNNSNRLVRNLEEWSESYITASVPRWTVQCERGHVVEARQLLHKVPCWGYVITEPDRTELGALVRSKVEAAGLDPTDSAVMGKLMLGEAVVAPSGRAVAPEDVRVPPLRGRKVVVLGDTHNSTHIEDAAAGADLLVHEATFSRGMELKAAIAGHSTSTMAGRFAARVGARALVLTHFSPRYAALPDNVDGSGLNALLEKQERLQEREVMQLIKEARREFRGEVKAARDFLTIDIPALPLDTPWEQPDPDPAPLRLDYQRLASAGRRDNDSAGGGSRKRGRSQGRPPRAGNRR
ncbi:unnamed protein product [Pedinophyceae sp. YPF-701]|nr:unnamed protein product [Pedinophyceae sp. YPF-701]